LSYFFLSPFTIVESNEKMVNTAEYFLRTDDCVTREIAGETVIVPIRSRVGDLDSIYNLNEMGTRIWGLIDPGRSVEEIVQTVCDEYDVTPAQAREDVAAFLSHLKEAGLIRPKGI
jgi:Coenzyme PQQ synthesis protein D (PqqD)